MIDDAVKSILNQGLLGAITVVLGFTVVFLYRENRSVNKEYLDFVKNATNSLTQPLAKIQETSDKIVERLEHVSDTLLKIIKT